ncbi:hypothetical protein KY023_003278 [Vibrio vulnificus]|nr:hypothetical protein [Vibrio vulnificus]
MKIEPNILTFITTYQCTAACKECCFECTPKLTAKLSESQILQTLQTAKDTYPSIKLAVFTGGECFLLKNSLFKAISKATSLGFSTRCVTNAYWAKTKNNANKIVDELKLAGLNELNISTGIEHQEWVDEDCVINAAEALLDRGIVTVITVEKDSETTNIYHRIMNNPRIISLFNQYDNKIIIQQNSWMPFHEDYKSRGYISSEVLKSGCDQVFNNITITPHGIVSACCGLTMEHIPEMKLGTINNLTSFSEKQEDDFLKRWIKIDGPYSILEKMTDDHSKLNNVVHPCQACAIIHKDMEVRENIKKRYKEHIIPIIFKENIIQSIEYI